jgi:hypothetical protein
MGACRAGAKQSQFVPDFPAGGLAAGAADDLAEIVLSAA